MNIDFSSDLNLKSLFPQTEFEEKVISFLKDWYSESEMVSVQTSGSTGIPKVFGIEKKKMSHSAKMTCGILGLKARDSALLCLPVEYISGKMMIVRAIERSLNLFVQTPSAKPLNNFNEETDFCAMSPLQVENSLDQLYLIKNLIIGGAAVSESLKSKIHASLEVQKTSVQSKIYETYGMSETLSHIALKEIYPKAAEYFSVLDGVDITLDERGCLQISAPKLNPELLITNDLVEIKHNERQKENKEFKFLGRIDNVINSAGLKIFPEQLENLVKKEIHNEAIFTGIKDVLFGQKLVLIIEGEESEMIKKKLSEIVYPSKNHQPKEIIFVKNFPRIPNGKVNRKELLKLL